MNSLALDRIINTLEWYALEAEALQRNLEAKNNEAILASVTVLALDGGSRAKDAIAILSLAKQAKARNPSG